MQFRYRDICLETKGHMLYNKRVRVNELYETRLVIMRIK